MRGILTNQFIRVPLAARLKRFAKPFKQKLGRRARFRKRKCLKVAIIDNMETSEFLQNNSADCEIDRRERNSEDDCNIRGFKGKQVVDTNQDLQKDGPTLNGNQTESAKIEFQFRESVVNQKETLITPAWLSAVDSILESSAHGCSTHKISSDLQISNPVVVVCGGKNVGKSSFARYLVNSLFKRYNKVGYLDTDVGQPELTPSGCLSLHILDKPITGTTSLEMRNPDRCYFFGDVSPKSNPELYIRCIEALYDHFCQTHMGKVDVRKMRSEDLPVPLVVNTHGWVKGIGLVVLTDMLRYISPTHVVHILSQNEQKNLPHGKFWDSELDYLCTTKILNIKSVIETLPASSQVKMNPKELRDLRSIAYFRKCLEEESDAFFRDASAMSFETGIALVHHIPYQVPMSAIKVVHMHCQVPSSETFHSINGTLVGLGISTASFMLSHENEKAPLPPVCAGLGIVRGVDIRKQCFYVITPLSQEKLQGVNTFMKGYMDIPISLLQVQNYLSPYLCRNTLVKEGTGSASMGSAKKKLLRGGHVRING